MIVKGIVISAALLSRDPFPAGPHNGVAKIKWTLPRAGLGTGSKKRTGVTFFAPGYLR